MFILQAAQYQEAVSIRSDDVGCLQLLNSDRRIERCFHFQCGIIVAIPLDGAIQPEGDFRRIFIPDWLLVEFRRNSRNEPGER